MTKNERARLEAEFKFHWKDALKWQETEKQYAHPATAMTVLEKAAIARGYGYALCDMLGWQIDDVEIPKHIHELIEDAENEAGIKTSRRINPMGW